MTDVKEQLAQTLFDHIPVGVGSQGIIATSAKDLEAALEMGMDWSLREVCSFTSADQGVHGALIASASGRSLRIMSKAWHSAASAHRAHSMQSKSGILH